MGKGKPTASTIGGVLAWRAASNPDAPAIVHARLQAISFARLVSAIEALGSQLRAAGLGTTSRVGIALPRGPESAVLSLAVCSTSILLPLNPNLTAAELEEELKQIRLDALIVPEGDLPGWVKPSGNGFGVFKAAVADSSWDQIKLEQVLPVPRSCEAAEVSPQSWAAIFKTSGTTGWSKRVPVTHENLIEMARKMERWLKLGPGDRSTCIMPIYYNAGFKATLLAPLLAGCSVAMPQTPSANDIDRWLVELRPTWLTASPAFLQAVVERLAALPGGVKHSLRFVLSTASYLPEATRVELERLFAIPVVEFYGLCEAGMMTAPALPPDLAKPGSVGRAPEGELAVRADDGRLLGPGQTGQIVLRGPSVMPGYLFDDIDGKPAGLEDGWLPTGDLGTIDEQGFLTIVGRTKEIINRGGEKISPYEVEKVLLEHPAVREAAAFAVPHPRLGETVGAAAVLRSGAKATSAELVDFLYERLAPFQMPRQVHVVDSMPVGATGKISRPKLSETFRTRGAEPVEQPDSPLELQIAEIWQRLLKRTDIGMDDDFFEIGGDSLQATEMLLELEEMSRHAIAPSEVGARLTIRHLTEVLAHSAESKREILTLAKPGQGTPLFFFHGDFSGWGFYAFRLVDLLKKEGPVYLLHSILDPDKGIETLEQMASRYLPLIMQVAPNGPVRLGGYCHGGLAALQVAQELEKAGRRVESVVLIDALSINARPIMRMLMPLVTFVSRFVPGAFGRKIRRSGPPTLWRFVTHLLHGDMMIGRRMAKVMRTGQSLAWDESQRSDYYRAMSKFVPARIKAKIICLLCDEYRTKEEYAAASWKHVSPTVQSGNLPGRHNTCITTHVDVLADCFNQMSAA
ncbi:MAG: AMP-binding protein [Proteobacteria bacterium]|nr:AMP-binding protein [Pseudomonadota bacterium]